jgi:serine/threonine protein kinase
MHGRTISHYEIAEKLGEGGMGVVYKAKDTHLDRLVALKLLPPDKVSDPERIRRFVQEAKAASALNHPNIVTIYDIDTADGVTFIAMEYIQGRTLEQWIRSRGSLGDILKYGAQIASALTAAHAKGIIHRDLKPGNIMISDAGLAKVLDFGLAKLTEIAVAGEEAATRTIRQGDVTPTEEGRIVGTASYMAPEQAEGKTIDARTDIFALGAVLYEMVSGRRAFQGDTAISTLSAILKTDPKPLRELAPNTPGEVERIVTRCLRKDPSRRFQHMDDLKVALDEMREESDSGKLSAVAATPGRRRRSLVWIVGLIALIWAAGLYLGIRTPEKQNTGPVLTRLTSDTGLTLDPTFWAQGNLLAYASDRAGGRLDIYVQQLGGGEPHRVTSNEADDHEPDFSPDGTRIVFRSERDGGGLYIVPSLGGVERKIRRSRPLSEVLPGWQMDRLLGWRAGGASGPVWEGIRHAVFRRKFEAGCRACFPSGLVSG